MTGTRYYGLLHSELERRLWTDHVAGGLMAVLNGGCVGNPRLLCFQ
jgi:hypothetical protein